MATFALISDPHITVPNPETGWMVPPIANEPTMYHRSVELLETAIAEINALPDLDFVLICGDLTKDSEPYNHTRARELFAGFRKPVYCVSGNHDQSRSLALRPAEYLDPSVSPVETVQIPHWYGDFGFDSRERLAYSCDPTPDVHLIGICSAKQNEDRGRISAEILAWLDEDLSHQRDTGRETLLMLHHSIIDHVPGESVNPAFSWFHVENSSALKAVLRRHGVRVTLTGHLHIQDIKEENGLYNIATASLAGFPHAYRVMHLREGALDIRSHRLRSIPSLPDLQRRSREETADTFVQIISSALTEPPFRYTTTRATAAAQALRQWWPSIADGDEHFDYSAAELGDPALAAYVNAFSDRPPADNDVVLELPRR